MAHRFSNLGGKEGDSVTSEARGRLGFGMCERVLVRPDDECFYSSVILCVYVCGCLVTWLCFLSVTPMGVAHQTPLFRVLFQQELLEWVVIFSFRISSRPKDRTPHLLRLLHRLR